MPVESGQTAKHIANTLLVSFLLTGCGLKPAEHDVKVNTPTGLGGSDALVAGKPPPGLADVLKLPGSNADESSTGGNIRNRHQREAALRFGSQSGFRFRVWEINRLIESRSREISTVYDFNRVARPAPGGAGFLIPPVVQRAENALQSDTDGRTISVADEYYRILKPERLAPVTPTWRDWLLIDHPDVRGLPSSLAPASNQERKQVAEWIRQGWQAGTEQADAELAERLRRLRRDYEGMLDFRQLAARGMIDGWKVAIAEFGVTGQPGEMRTGDRVVRIVGTADFRRKPEHWRTDPTETQAPEADADSGK